MLIRVVLTSAFVLCTFSATGEEEYNYAPACTAPEQPATIDGATATQADLSASHDALTRFISASDSYQSCLGRALGKQQDTAFFMHSNVPKHIVRQIEGKAAASQKQKEQVATAYNAAVAAFRARSGTP